MNNSNFTIYYANISQQENIFMVFPSRFPFSADTVGWVIWRASGL